MGPLAAVLGTGLLIGASALLTGHSDQLGLTSTPEQRRLAIGRKLMLELAWAECRASKYNKGIKINKKTCSRLRQIFREFEIKKSSRSKLAKKARPSKTRVMPGPLSLSWPALGPYPNIQKKPQDPQILSDSLNAGPSVLPAKGT